MPSKTTTAFFLQSAVSFGVAVVGLGIGIAYLPVNQWMRAFLGIGLLYTVTSAFTLAKCVRDHQESTAVVQRVDCWVRSPPRQAAHRSRPVPRVTSDNPGARRLLRAPSHG